MFANLSDSSRVLFMDSNDQSRNIEESSAN